MSDGLSGSKCHLSLHPSQRDWQRSTRPVENQYKKSCLCLLFNTRSPRRLRVGHEEERKVCITWNVLFSTFRAGHPRCPNGNTSSWETLKNMLPHCPTPGKCCIKWSFFPVGLPGYVDVKRKYVQFSELVRRSLYSQHISSHLGFSEPLLWSSASDAREASLEPRSGYAGAMIRHHLSSLQNERGIRTPPRGVLKLGPWYHSCGLKLLLSMSWSGHSHHFLPLGTQLKNHLLTWSEGTQWAHCRTSHISDFFVVPPTRKVEVFDSLPYPRASGTC